MVSADETPTPDDPDWVDEVMNRAFERADAEEIPQIEEPRKDPGPVERAVPQQDPVARPPRSEPSPRESRAVTPSGAEGPGRQEPVAQDNLDDAEVRAADFGVSSQRVNPRMRGILEWGAVVLGALAVALLIKTFLMQAYFIPSSSMVPTLNEGDRILVNKVSYKLHDVNRGDLVVFNRPPNLLTGEDDLIKRVIALEGERISIINNGNDPSQILIDGLLLTEPYLPEGMVTITKFSGTEGCADSGPDFCVVRTGHVFVMGDNRTSSQDSRFFGPIDEELIVGRAFLRVWPLGEISAL